MKVRFEEFETEIKSLEGDIINIDFNGALLVQFERKESIYIATNAVDDWGDNCIHLYHGKQLEILD